MKGFIRRMRRDPVLAFLYLTLVVVFVGMTVATAMLWSI
jgi:hypothetical protein